MARSKSPAPRRRREHEEETSNKNKKKDNNNKMTKKNVEEEQESSSVSSSTSSSVPDIHQAMMMMEGDDTSSAASSMDNDEDEDERSGEDLLTKPSSKAESLDILTFKHGIPKSAELQDFLWSMSDEPHASRRKQMIKDHPDLKHLMGYEPRTKYIVVLMTLTQLFLAYHFREQALYGGTWQFWLTAYVVGATLTQAQFLAIHEISHNLAFKSFTMNKVFGIFANIPMVLPFFIAFKHYHNEHHKMQGVDGIDTDIPTKLEARLLSSFFGKLFFLFNQTWFYAFRPLFVRQQQLTTWHVANFLVQATFVTSTIYFIGWGPIFYLLACAHLAGSLHPMASHFIAEHYTFAGKVETASYYGPLNNLAFNVGYHNEHHDFPTVPWSRLHKLKEMGDYDQLPFHESWPRVLYEFLFNPEVTLYNRVIRADKEKAKSVKGASDSADYTGSWLLGTGMDVITAEASNTNDKKVD